MYYTAVLTKNNRFTLPLLKSLFRLKFGPTTAKKVRHILAISNADRKVTEVT